MNLYDTIIGKDTRVAKKILEEGQIVGIPTETVYGLAGNALNEEAALKIFAVKNRPRFDPLIVHTYSTYEVNKYVLRIPEKAQILMENFMPGPLTLLLPKKGSIPDIVTSGLDTVAIRIPDHPLTLQLLKELSFPLAAPSANPFGYISPTTAQHVWDQLQGKIPYILDGGPTSVGVESTILGFEHEEAVIYRVGGLAVEDIRKIIGRVKIETGMGPTSKAPGMMKNHYAPKKEMWFGKAGSKVHAQAMKTAKAKKVAIVAFDKYLEEFDTENQTLLSPKGNLEEAAKNLFATIRKLDDSDADAIFAVPFPNVGLGRAINDRLKRASN